MAPGAYESITARLIEQAGFPSMYMTAPAPLPRAATPNTPC